MIGLIFRLSAVAGLGLVLANCSGGPGRIDPRYGVASSARVVEPGKPVPKGGGVYRVGKPYVVAGREYVPQEDVNYHAVGMASWYGDDFHGRYTANGEVFDMNSLSAAHPTLPLPSYVRVTNLANHRSIVVRVNDRGPYVGNRLIDVSVRTAKLLGFYGEGVTKVKVEYVGRAPLEGSDDRKLAATLREPGMKMKPVEVASNKTFAPAYFDSRPMAEMQGKVPSPPDRPFRLGQAPHEVPAAAPPPAKRYSVAGATQPAAVPVQRTAAIEEEPMTSPVSAYAPVRSPTPARYDGAAAGFLSGRGLY